MANKIVTAIIDHDMDFLIHFHGMTAAQRKKKHPRRIGIR